MLLCGPVCMLLLPSMTTNSCVQVGVASATWHGVDLAGPHDMCATPGACSEWHAVPTVPCGPGQLVLIFGLTHRTC